MKSISHKRRLQRHQARVGHAQVPPRLAVLMTVYNGEMHLIAALDSLLRQTYADFTLHIVDDGSTDGTSGILERYSSQDPRIIVYYKPHTGIVDSVNLGLSSISAEYLARADADDISVPERFAIQVGVLDAEPDLMATSGKGRQIDWKGKDLGTFTFLQDPGLADAFAIPAREPYLTHPFLMVRMSALNDVGGYRNLPVAEDSDLCWRLHAKGRLKNLDVELGSYRLNPESMSSRSVKMGRLMCAFSQLAAISAQRRAAGEGDLCFSSELSELLQSSLTSLDAVAAALQPALTSQESEWFRAAASAKLIEMAVYRPYEVEASDTRFLSRALRYRWRNIPADGKRELRRMCSGAAARLIPRGEFSCAWPLLSLANPFTTLLRTSARIALPRWAFNAARRRLHAQSGSWK